MKKKYNSKFYKSPIIVDSVNGDILVYVKTNKGRDIIYSGYDTNEKKCHIPYINKCLLGGFVRGIPKSVLILGLGGGSYARYLEDHIDDVIITGVDIDPVMIEISRKEMNVSTSDLICGSAESTVKSLGKKNRQYDLILIDCYLGDGEIPNSIMSGDFFLDCKNVLSKGGVLSVNMSEFFLDNSYENILRVQRYRDMHINIKRVFGHYFSLLLMGEEDGSNSMGIYNLDKLYSANDFNNNYLENVENLEIIFDNNLIKDTYLDKSLFLQ